MSESGETGHMRGRATFARRLEQCLRSLHWMGFLDRDPLPTAHRLLPRTIRPLRFRMTLRHAHGELTLGVRGMPGALFSTRDRGPAPGVQWLICKRLPDGEARRSLASNRVAYTLAEVERRMAEAVRVFDACGIGRLRQRLEAQRRVHPGAFEAGMSELRGYEAMVLGCFPELTAAAAA